MTRKKKAGKVWSRGFFSRHADLSFRKPKNTLASLRKTELQERKNSKKPIPKVTNKKKLKKLTRDQEQKGDEDTECLYSVLNSESI